MGGFLGRAFLLVPACAVGAGLLGGISSPRVGSSTGPDAGDERTRVLDAYAQSPLSFEENWGQTDPQVRYLTRGEGYTLYLTDSEAVFSLPGARSETGAVGPTPTPSGAALSMGLVGVEPAPEVGGRGPLPGVVSYFKGSDPQGWHSGVPTFARVHYGGVYPGIDLVFRGTRHALEYDFLLAPGADPGRIALRFRGAGDLRIDEHGDLVITTAVGELVHRAPAVYQEVGGERREVTGTYRLYGRRVGFVLGAYDRALPLVIDPVVLAYSTFLGGSGGDNGEAIAVDGAGAAYITGRTEDAATDLPTSSGAYDETHNGADDVFVTKLGPTGAAPLTFSTFLGGSGNDLGNGVAVDGAGAAYVTGETEDAATDLPTTSGAYDETHNGDSDAFVTKLGPTGGSLAYSTFLGGTASDFGLGIALDGAGRAYVAGGTEDAATDLPTTAGAYDETHNGAGDVFVTKLGPTGGSLAYSTFLGGTASEVANGITVDGDGAAYVTGPTEDDATDFPTTAGAYDQTHNGTLDAFVTKVGPSGDAVGYSTFLGGSVDESGIGIAVDGAGAAYVTGLTASTGFPTTGGAFDVTHNGAPGLFDAFVTKLGPTGAGLAYSTFLGGSGDDIGFAIAVDGAGAAYVTGPTGDAATDFPTTAGAYDETHNGASDVFVTKVGPTGAALSYSTFLGGSSFDDGIGIAVDGAGRAYVTGGTEDAITDLPTTAGAYDETHNGAGDVFVTKLVETAPPGPPPPGPQPQPSPQAKELTLKAKPRKVEPGERTRLTAEIEPCVPATQNDTVEFRKGSKVLAEKAVTDACVATKKVKVNKKTRFRAVSPADADSAEASDKVVVKVTGG